MPLYTPYFSASPKADSETGDEYTITHNCDGSLNFPAVEVVDARTYRLIDFAFTAGRRAKAKEFRELLDMEK